MEIQTAQYGTLPSPSARPKRSAYWPAQVPQAAPRQNGPTPHFRATIWLIIALITGFTLWLAQVEPVEPIDYSPLFLKLSPSDWTEQSRVSSPDGRLDAVVVVADDGAHLRPKGELEEGLTGLQSEEAAEPRQILSLRIVPAGEKVGRERPYFEFSQEFQVSVAAKSVFVSEPTPELTVQWKNNDVLMVNHAPQDAIARLDKTEVVTNGEAKPITIRYQP